MRYNAPHYGFRFVNLIVEKGVKIPGVKKRLKRIGGPFQGRNKQG